MSFVRRVEHKQWSEGEALLYLRLISSRHRVANRWMIDNQILRRRFVVRYPQPLPIGDELDGAILICTVDVVLA